MAAQPSPSSKKNRQRRKAKAGSAKDHGVKLTDPEPEQPVLAVAQVAPPPPLNPVAELKRKVEVAKENKDHELAQTLRQQLWALQDTLITGSTGLGAPPLDPSLLLPSAPQPAAMSTDRMMSSFDVVEKMIIKLRKKLKAIGDLKERLAKGEKLEANQLAKIQTESDIIEEIHALEVELLSNQLR